MPGARVPTAAKLQWGNQRSATHTHNGFDIPAPEGTPVVAAAGGRVERSSAAWEQGFTGYGGHVVVRVAPAEWHLYAHLSAVDVAPGQLVLQGQQLGRVGRTAFTAADHGALLQSGPHLHFERSPRAYPQRSELARLDPMPVLGGATVRSLADLSALFVKLRAATVDRAGNPRKGVDPAVAEKVLAIVEGFRQWADASPAMIPNEEWTTWERRYMAGLQLLGPNALELERIDPDRANLLERALGAVGIGAGIALALMFARGRK